MGQLFGKPASKAAKAPSSEKRTVSDKDKAVLKLKRARDKLTKFQKKTDLDAEKLQNQAKDLLLKGRKQHALMALKIRKIKLKEVASVDSKLLNVVQMIEDIEWDSQNIEVLQALEAGTAALDKLHKEMPIEEVERILEESAESMEMQSQISDMLSAGQLSEVDEDELEAQLEALGEEEETEKIGKTTEVRASGTVTEKNASSLHMPDAPATPLFPAVPTHDVVRKGASQNTENELEGDRRVAA